MISSFLFMLVYATQPHLTPKPYDDSSFHEYVKMDTLENRN